MKIGILVLFYNDEKEIIKTGFSNLLTISDTKVCFVNNGSKDNTLAALELVKGGKKKDVSVLDIKKNKGFNAAIKAGARYLFSKENLTYIVYMKSNMLAHLKDLEKQLKINEINFFFQEIKKAKASKEIFCISEILDLK